MSFNIFVIRDFDGYLETEKLRQWLRKLNGAYIQRNRISTSKGEHEKEETRNFSG